MVKGVSRRVIVVDAPDQRYFDRAIFILRSDAPADGNYGGVVSEACRIASRYARRQRGGFSPPAPLWALPGAGIVALAWFLSSHGLFA